MFIVAHGVGASCWFLHSKGKESKNKISFNLAHIRIRLVYFICVMTWIRTLCVCFFLSGGAGSQLIGEAAAVGTEWEGIMVVGNGAQPYRALQRLELEPLTTG